MSTLIGILAVLFMSVFLYRLLTTWMERRDAGTFATFVALGGSCALFTFAFLPFEFPDVGRLFGVLVVAVMPFFLIAQRKNNQESQSLLPQEEDLFAELFEKGDRI